MRNQDQVYLILLVESLRGEYFLRCIFSAKNAQNLVNVQNFKKLSGFADVARKECEN